MHLSQEGHVIDWNNAKMRLKSNNVYERKMLESILIQKTPNFNLCEGHWKLDKLTTTLITKAFPELDVTDVPRRLPERGHALPSGLPGSRSGAVSSSPSTPPT